MYPAREAMMSPFIRRLPHVERIFDATHAVGSSVSYKACFGPQRKISFGPFRLVLIHLPPPEGDEPLSALSLPTSAGCSGPSPSALGYRWLPRSIRSTLRAGTDLRVIRLERVER